MNPTDNEMSTPCPYDVGIASAQTFQRHTQGHNIYCTLWKKTFENLDLSLVDAEGLAPPNVLNCQPYGSDHDKSTSHVVLNKGNGDNDKTMYMAVLDTLDPKRAFIGQYVLHEERATLIGGVCYFDSNGKLEGPITAFDRIVFEDPGSNFKQPSWRNMILCGDVLVYAREYCRMFRQGHLSFGGWVLRNDTLSEAFGWTGIATPSSEVNAWCPEIVFGRWLCLKDDPGKNIACIDLKSFRSMKNENELIVRGPALTKSHCMTEFVYPLMKSMQLSSSLLKVDFRHTNR